MSNLASQFAEKKSVVVPKNGNYLVAVLAGGPPDIYREMKKSLGAEKGIDVRYHWDYQHEHQFDTVPRDADLVIMLKDLISHPLHDRVKKMCKLAGVSLIRTQRKGVALRQALYSHGIKNAIVPLALLQEQERIEQGKLKDVEPEKLIATPVEKKQQVNVSILVHQALNPAPEQPRRQGIPSPETAALIAALMSCCAADGITVMVSPTEMNVCPVK